MYTGCYDLAVRKNEEGILKGLNPRDKKGGDGINYKEQIIFSLITNTLISRGERLFIDLNQLHLE